MAAQRRYSHPVNRSTGVRFVQKLVLQGYQAAKDYPQPLRGIRFQAAEPGKRLLFVTNSTALPALSTRALYKGRGRVDRLVRGIKPHLCVKVSFATIENAAKSRIGTAASVYVLVAIGRERRNLYRSVDELLQMWRLNEVEKTPLDMLVSRGVQAPDSQQPDNQRILFE